jgi:hemolysin III
MSSIMLRRRANTDERCRSAALLKESTLNLGCRAAAIAQGSDEELANGVTHALGLVLSLAGISVLATLAQSIGTARYAVGCGVYGASLVMVYAASTLFHCWPSGDIKRFFLLLDHIGIYALIAGTYTPMALFASRGVFTWSCVTAAWGFAAVGSCAKVIRIGRLHEDFPAPYLVLSALCLISVRQLVANAPPGQSTWLLAGVLFYFAGLFFYLNSRKRFYHSIWHLFVLAGSICHYRVVLRYVITATF